MHDILDKLRYSNYVCKFPMSDKTCDITWLHSALKNIFAKSISNSKNPPSGFGPHQFSQGQVSQDQNGKLETIFRCLGFNQKNEQMNSKFAQERVGNVLLRPPLSTVHLPLNSTTINATWLKFL
jgi:hypothetical protein